MDDVRKRQLVLIFGFVFIDLLGYSLILPLLPFYAESFGASITLVGLLGTANALAQLVAAPTIGRLSDKYGRRPLLIFCIAGAVLSFIVIGTARSVPMLFLSRVMDGLLGGNTALARAYITDITDDSNRAKGMGIIGAAFGLGFIIGPAMGGLLSRFGYAFPALVAAGLSLLNLVAVIAWLPESLGPEERSRMRDSVHTAFNLKELVGELRRPCVGALLQIQLLYSLAFILFQSTFALYAKEHLGLNARTTSFVLTYVGLLSVLVQGLAIGRLAGRFSERALIFAGTLILAGAFALWAIVPNVWLLLIVLMPIALAAGILNVMLSTQLTKAVYKEDVGGTLGLAASLRTLAQIIMPGLGGLLLDSAGAWSLGLVSGLLMASTALLVQRTIMRRPEITGPCDRDDQETILTARL